MKALLLPLRDLGKQGDELVLSDGVTAAQGMFLGQADLGTLARLTCPLHYQIFVVADVLLK